MTTTAFAGMTGEGVVLGTDPDKEVARILNDFLHHPEIPRRLGLAARARAERDYAAAVLFGRYRDLIAEAAHQ